MLPPFVIATVFRPTSAKYGDRGERYMHIEAGHAAENVCPQAVVLGLGTTIVGAFSCAEVKRLSVLVRRSRSSSFRFEGLGEMIDLGPILLLVAPRGRIWHPEP